MSARLSHQLAAKLSDETSRVLNDVNQPRQYGRGEPGKHPQQHGPSLDGPKLSPGGAHTDDSDCPDGVGQKGQSTRQPRQERGRRKVGGTSGVVYREVARAASSERESQGKKDEP